MHNETSSIEAVERYWSASPCNVRRSRNTPGTLAFFDDIARNKRLVEPHGAQFANFPELGGKIVIDVGCGLGTDLVSFADYGAEVVGVDVSTVSLELARKNLERHGLMHRCLALLNRDFEQLELTGTGAMEPDLIWSFGRFIIRRIQWRRCCGCTASRDRERYFAACCITGAAGSGWPRCAGTAAVARRRTVAR